MLSVLVHIHVDTEVQAVGLQARYEADIEFALPMSLLPVLAFIPIEDVISAFETLCKSDELPQSCPLRRNLS